MGGTHSTWAYVMAAYQHLRERRNQIVFLFPERAEFETYIEDWMSMPAKYRKDLSYSGAVRQDHSSLPHLAVVPQARSGERQYPADYDDLQCMFDPGNWTYFKAMQFISPGLLTRHGWNEETVGDIWEGILGYRFLYHDSPDADEHLLEFAAWADSYINSVHSFVFLSSAMDPAFYDLQPIREWGAFVRSGCRSVQLE